MNPTKTYKTFDSDNRENYEALDPQAEDFFRDLEVYAVSAQRLVQARVEGEFVDTVELNKALDDLLRD